MKRNIYANQYLYFFLYKHKKNMKEIQIIENKIKEIKNMLKKYKTEINQHENKLSSLIQQVAELRKLENKKNIK